MTAWRTFSTSMVISITVGNSAWADRQVKNNLALCGVAPFCMNQSVFNGKPTSIRWATKLAYHSQTVLAVQSLSVANVTIKQWLDVAIHTVSVGDAFCRRWSANFDSKKTAYSVYSMCHPIQNVLHLTYSACSVISSCSTSPTNCTILISGEFLQHCMGNGANRQAKFTAQIARTSLNSTPVFLLDFLALLCMATLTPSVLLVMHTCPTSVSLFQ